MSGRGRRRPLLTTEPVLPQGARRVGSARAARSRIARTGTQRRPRTVHPPVLSPMWRRTTPSLVPAPGSGGGTACESGRRFVDGRRRPPGVGRVDYANAPSSRGPPRGGAPSPPSDTLAGGRRDATDARRVRDERGLRPHLRRRPSPRGGVRRWRTRQWRGEGTGRVPPPAPPAVPRWTPRGGRSKAARPSAAWTSRAPGGEDEEEGGARGPLANFATGHLSRKESTDR